MNEQACPRSTTARSEVKRAVLDDDRRSNTQVWVRQKTLEKGRRPAGLCVADKAARVLSPMTVAAALDSSVKERIAAGLSARDDISHIKGRTESSKRDSLFLLLCARHLFNWL